MQTSILDETSIERVSLLYHLSAIPSFLACLLSSCYLYRRLISWYRKHACQINISFSWRSLVIVIRTLEAESVLGKGAEEFVEIKTNAEAM